MPLPKDGRNDAADTWWVASMSMAHKIMSRVVGEHMRCQQSMAASVRGTACSDDVEIGRALHDRTELGDGRKGSVA